MQSKSCVAMTGKHPSALRFSFPFPQPRYKKRNSSAAKCFSIKINQNFRFCGCIFPVFFLLSFFFFLLRLVYFSAFIRSLCYRFILFCSSCFALSIISAASAMRSPLIFHKRQCWYWLWVFKLLLASSRFQRRA